MLPLVPVYLANLAGEVFRLSGSSQSARRQLFLHFGRVRRRVHAGVRLRGRLGGIPRRQVQQHLDTATRVGGVLLVVFGLQMSGLIHIPYLDRTYQLPA